MGPIAALRAAVPLMLGFMIGAALASLYGSVVTVPAAGQAGAMSERLVWQEAQRESEAKADADRRDAQARIDAIERSFHQREAERFAQLTALETAIEQETSHVPIPSAADRGVVACRPAVPRGLRDALDGVGRAAPSHDPADAPAAVR